MRRLLLPTEEFPIRSNLQLIIEFVAAIGEGGGGGDGGATASYSSAPSLKASTGFVVGT